MRDHRDAHYLHERREIEPLISPPIDEARVLDWLPDREELLVGSASGMLAGCAAVAAYAMPLKLNILVAIAAAVAIGLLMDHGTPRLPSAAEDRT